MTRDFLRGRDRTRTARPRRRRGKQQPSGLLFSARFPTARNVYQESSACQSTVCTASVGRYSFSLPLSKPPIFRTKRAKSWPVLPLRRRDFWIILLTCILFCIFLFSRAKGGILTNYLFQFARILAFCFLGEICHAVLPLPIPASIYGLLLLLAALRFGIVKLEQVKEVGLFLTGIFPLLFVPAAAGVMELWAEMGEMLLPIVIAIIPVTVLVLVSAGRTTQALTSRRAAKKEAEHD